MIEFNHQEKFDSFRKKQRDLFLNTENEKLINRLTSVWYFPESNILPPCFVWSVKHPDWKTYYPIENKKLKWLKLGNVSNLVSLATPKWEFHERVFSIIDPKIYNDISYHLINDKTRISDIIFSKGSKIYSYSIPLPPTFIDNNKNIFKIKNKIKTFFYKIYSFFSKRKKTLIYNIKECVYKKSWESINRYIAGENNLLEVSHAYKFYLQTDIKNFYPSIYTHSISWALEWWKKQSRNKKWGDMKVLGNRIDVLFQKSHDNCTNWICIWPTLSDFIWEIILSTIDIKVSKKAQDIDFVWMRYKDDYKILCKNEEDCKKILKFLRDELLAYKLYIHEEKTVISWKLPHSILRNWIIEVDHLLNLYLVKSNSIKFKEFKVLYAKVLKVNDEYPNHSIFEKMLSKLVNKNTKLKISFKNNQELKLFLSLLIQIKNSRLQTLPLILWIFEIIIKVNKKDWSDELINEILKKEFYSESISEYELLWIGYFFKKMDWNHSKIETRLKKEKNLLLKTLWENKQKFFKDFNLFDPKYISDKLLWECIELFWYDFI